MPAMEMRESEQLCCHCGQLVEVLRVIVDGWELGRMRAKNQAGMTESARRSGWGLHFPSPVGDVLGEIELQKCGMARSEGQRAEVRRDAVRKDAARRDAAQNDVVQRDVVQRDAVQRDEVRRDAARRAAARRAEGQIAAARIDEV